MSYTKGATTEVWAGLGEPATDAEAPRAGKVGCYEPPSPKEQGKGRKYFQNLKGFEGEGHSTGALARHRDAALTTSGTAGLGQGVNTQSLSILSTDLVSMPLMSEPNRKPEGMGARDGAEHGGGDPADAPQIHSLPLGE